jgi:hypothetical protein
MAINIGSPPTLFGTELAKEGFKRAREHKNCSVAIGPRAGHPKAFPHSTPSVNGDNRAGSVKQKIFLTESRKNAIVIVCVNFILIKALG